MEVPSAQPRRSGRLWGGLPAILLLAGGTALSVVLFVVARSSELRRLQMESDRIGYDIQTVLQGRLASSLGTLRAIADLYASSREVDRLEFQQFTRSALREARGFRALAWAPRVDPGDRDGHRRRMIESLQVSPDYRVQTSPDATELYPLVFIEPLAPFAGLRGTNLVAEPATADALARAIERGEPAATVDHPRFLQMLVDCLVVYPIYRRGAAVETVEQRRQQVEGVAVGMLNFQELVHSAARDLNLHGQQLYLVDGGQGTSGRVLYESRPGVAELARRGDAGRRVQPWQQAFDLGGRELLLRGVPSASSDDERRLMPWGILAASLALTVTVAAYVRSLGSRAREVQLLVERRTQQLQQSERRHRAVVEQAAEGITLVDAETLRILEVNQAFERLLGYGHDELIGRPIAELIVDTAEGVAAHARDAVEHGSSVAQRQYRRKDGSIVEVERSAATLELDGRRVLCTLIHDVTERRRAQRLLEEKNAQLQAALEAERRALDQLQSAQSQLIQAEKMAGLGQMVAGVAHEINNPLSFVANNVAVIQRDLAALRRLIELYRSTETRLEAVAPETLEQLRELCERIDLDYTLPNLDDMLSRSREGLRRIQQIVRDLRDFARLDEGELKDADLNAGIQSTANIILGRAKRKQVTIDLRLGSLPLVHCHAAKINQVVMNLLSNAIDASPTGGTVSVITAVEPEGVCIEVADQGPGVPAAIRPRIFDPFFTTKPQGEGTGLGLSISYGIIKDHGGRIDVLDAAGGGARFVVHLPLTPARSG